MAENPMVSSKASLYDLARYYDEKTARLLDKYGPGPRVHYHTGLSNGDFEPGASTADLSELMFGAQEGILDRLTEPLAGLARPCGGGPRILDVGCGLGGTSLYAAEKFGARMTAITIAAEHLPLVRGFAEQLGLSGQVEAREQDAHTMPGEACFEAAIAIEASCYLDRFVWLRRMAGLLVPGGRLFILDWMLGKKDESSDRVDEHWRTRMAPPEEYREAARAGGLVVEEEEVLNVATLGFWRLAREWNEAALREKSPDSAEKARLERSSREIANLETAFGSGSVLYERMIIRKPIKGE